MNNHQPIRVNQKHKKWLFSRETLNSNLKVRDIRTFVPVCTLLKVETSYTTKIIQCTFNVSPNKHHRSALSFIFSCSRKRFSACKTKPRKNENISDTASYNAPNVACSKFTITISCCCCLFLHYFNSGLGTLVHPEHYCPLDSVLDVLKILRGYRGTRPDTREGDFANLSRTLYTAVIPFTRNFHASRCRPRLSSFPQASFTFCLYSGTPPYGHLGNTITSLWRPLFLARKNGHTFPYKKNPR